ncbi:MAG: phosphatidate cytidylyltransferase [Nitrospirae bacterium]|nr:phosphatidate cytidylyltransferase [Nitrospirota bacterium]
MTGTRVVVALVALPLLYIIIWVLPPAAFFLLVLAAVLIGQQELVRMVHPATPFRRLAVGLVLGVLLVWNFYRMTGAVIGGAIDHATLAVGTALTGAVAAVLLVELLTGRRLVTALPAAVMPLFSALYLGWMLGHLILLRGAEQGAGAVLFVVAVTWMVDSAAYFGGRRFGSHPLAPIISPKKTIEGAVAGLAGGVATALVAQWWWFPTLTLAESAGVGLLLACVGQVGDLAESMIKRRAGVKDSGGWIPAHGGLLDKVDSLVFTAPTFYYYLVWVKDYGRVFM